MWSVILDGTNKEFSWKPTDPADEDTEVFNFFFYNVS